MALYPSVMHKTGSRQGLDNERGLYYRLQTRLGEEVTLQNIQEKTKVECREEEGGQVAREKRQMDRIPHCWRGSFTHPTTWQTQRKGRCTRKLVLTNTVLLKAHCQ